MISNEYEALTEGAQDFQGEVDAALRPIFEKHRGAFTYREMSYLVSEEIGLMTAELVIRAAIDKRRKERG